MTFPNNPAIVPWCSHGLDHTGSDTHVDFTGMCSDDFTGTEKQAVLDLIEKHGLTGSLKVETDPHTGYFVLLGTAPDSETHCFLNMADGTSAVFGHEVPGLFVVELLRYLQELPVGSVPGGTDGLISVTRKGHVIRGVEEDRYVPFTWDDVQVLLTA